MQFHEPLLVLALTSVVAAPLRGHERESALAPEIAFFSPVPSALVTRHSELHEATLQRNVRLELAALENDRGQEAARPLFRFELLDGEELRGRVTSLAPTPLGGYVAAFGIEGDSEGFVHLSVVGTAATATIRSRGKLWKINHVGGGEHTLSAVDEGLHEGCEPVAPQTLTPGRNPTPPPESVSDNLDIMVLYTDDARAANGGVDGVLSLIQLAVYEMNEGSARSDVETTLQLVHAEEVDFDEVGDMGDWLSQLRKKADGIIDHIHGLRDFYGADVVSLITKNSGGWCGKAYVMKTLEQGFEEFAFNVVHDGCATGNYTFAHEIGHNLGCTHDRDNATNGVFPYSYGWRTASSSYRTIMAYAPGSRVLNWSTPHKTAPNGEVLGKVDSEENWRSLNEATPLATTWRAGRDLFHQITTRNDANNGFAGNMFDITPKESLSLDGIDIHTSAAAGKNVSVRIWYRYNSFEGFTDTSLGWYLLGVFHTTALGEGLWTPFTINSPVTFAAGQTYGLYVEYLSYDPGGLGGSLRYTNGAPQAFHNNQLQLTSGVGKGVGFGGPTFADRVWNGRLRYRGADGAFSKATTFASNNGFAGNMFEVRTKGHRIQVQSFDLNVTGSVPVIADVWYRTGSYVGHEDDPAGWIFLGTDSKSLAQGQDKATRITFRDVKMLPNSTYSFYVNLTSYGIAGQTLRYVNGNSTYSNADLSIVSGVGKGDGAFTGTTFAERTWSGRVRYSPWR